MPEVINVTAADTHRNSQTRRARWWPVCVAVILEVVALVAIWYPSELDRMGRNVLTALSLVLTCSLLLIWLVAFSRLAWRYRLGTVAGLVLFAVVSASCVRLTGFSGDLVPSFAWKWTPRAQVFSAPDLASAATAGMLPHHQDYPQFLGPSRNAIVSGVRLATDWESDPPTVLWRRAVGEGWSGFAVSGDYAVTQEKRGDDELIVCYRLSSGEPLWEDAERGTFESWFNGSGPRATPTIVDAHVYAMGSTGRLTCLDLINGKRNWSVDVLADNSAENCLHGKSCSPLVVGENVIVSAGGKNGHSLVAYDRTLGHRVWSAGDDLSSYSSPMMVDLAGVPQILILNKTSLVGHDPVDGHVLWSEPLPAGDDAHRVAQPLLLDGNQLIEFAGFGLGGKRLRCEITEHADWQITTLWESRWFQPNFANFVSCQGSIYGLDGGILACIDEATGERRWKKGRYGHGQVMLVGDVILVMAESGAVALVNPDPSRHVELARFDALNNKTWNHPALAAPYLVVRNAEEAVCLELPLASPLADQVTAVSPTEQGAADHAAHPRGPARRSTLGNEP
ncbi:MAG: PQQ-binding-like beta-propeller repeat protein [Pirellulales bacterium]